MKNSCHINLSAKEIFGFHFQFIVVNACLNRTGYTVTCQKERHSGDTAANTIEVTDAKGATKVFRSIAAAISTAESIIANNSVQDRYIKVESTVKIIRPVAHALDLRAV